jgi:hypothetical protein
VPDFPYLTIAPPVKKNQPQLPKMSRIFLTCLLLASLTASTAVATPAPPTGRDIVKKMHDRYTGKWYHSFTFTQTTLRYQNDTALPAQTWHEFIRFPDRFRMDFGPADSGNAAIFRGDSSYRFRGGALAGATINNNEGLVFLLGGMFSYPLDQTFKILSDSLHYDLTQAKEDNWNGQPVYVIGKVDGNQLWIEQKNLLIVRMINADDHMDARFEDWKPFGGGYSETKCEFYINGKLVQVETYTDCKADINLEDRIFDPSKLNRSW